MGYFFKRILILGAMLLALPAGAQNVPTIGVAEAKQLLAVGTGVMLLDVRQDDEFAAGHIAKATLIPLDQLEQNLSKLPKDKKIIVYCRSGRRSATAVDLLQAKGFTNAVSLAGGFVAWGEAAAK